MGVDREYRIRITTAADNSGTKEAAKGLADLSREEQETGKQADKLSLSHRELHMALAQLGPEFSHFGGMAQYALHNQVLAPVLGIVGAFALWQHRINSCVEALGGIELPDNAKEQIGQVAALAESWRAFNRAVMDAATAADSVDEASKRTLETLKAEEEEKKKLLEADKKLELSELERQKTLLTTADYEARKAAIENRYEDQSASADDEARFKKLQEKAKQGAELVESSKQKMAEAGKIHLGTPEQEAAIDAQMKEQADAAEKSHKERQERINDIFAQRDHAGTFLEKLPRTARLIGRYGAFGASHAEAGGTEELELERRGGESEQTVIDRYKKRMEGKAARDDQEERRKKLIADAGKEAGEAYKIWQEGPGDVAAYQRSVDNKRAVAATESQAQRNMADAKALESPEAKLIRDVSAAEAILQHGGQISVLQQTEIKTLAERMRQSQIEQGAAIIAALGTIHNNTEGLTKQILDLAKRLDQQNKQLRNLAAPP